jgi:hypothetical protein
MNQLFPSSFESGKMLLPSNPYILYSAIATTGGDGNGLGVNDTGYTGTDEIWFLLTSQVTDGTLQLYSDGSGVWTPGTASQATAQYKLYKNGVADGTATITFNNGGTTIIQLAGGGGLAGPSGLAGPGGLAG